MDKIQASGNDGEQAVQYIKDIPSKRWTTIDGPLDEHPRFQQLTSNASESFWNAQEEHRKLNPASFLYAVFEELASTIYERSNRGFQNCRLTDYCVAVFNREVQASKYYDASPYSRTLAVVKDHNSRDIYEEDTQKVDLEKQVCTCAKWQDLRIPCRHAIAFLDKMYLHAEELIAPYWKINNYREAYNSPLEVVLLDELTPDPSIHMPGGLQATQPRARGRPTTKKRRIKPSRSRRIRLTQDRGRGFNAQQERLDQAASREDLEEMDYHDGLDDEERYIEFALFDLEATERSVIDPRLEDPHRETEYPHRETEYPHRETPEPAEDPHHETEYPHRKTLKPLLQPLSPPAPPTTRRPQRPPGYYLSLSGAPPPRLKRRRQGVGGARDAL
jgi:hypothetical protein